MTPEQEMKRDLIKDYFIKNCDGPWLTHMKNALQPIQFPKDGPTVSFEAAIEILYAEIEKKQCST